MMLGLKESVFSNVFQNTAASWLSFERRRKFVNLAIKEDGRIISVNWPPVCHHTRRERSLHSDQKL